MGVIAQVWCRHVWTDYSAFGDIDHSCGEMAYRKGLCKKHYEEDLAKRKQEKEWRKEQREQRKREQFIAEALDTVEQHNKVRRERGIGLCECNLCELHRRIFK